MRSANRKPPLVVALGPRIARADIPLVCADVRRALAYAEHPVVHCDAEGLVRPDAVAVDAIARLQLTVRRAGSKLRVKGADSELRQLLELAGLSDVVELIS